MDPVTIAAIVSAGLPLIMKLVDLGKLFIKGTVEKLTLPEVQTEIDKIMKRTADQDAEEWAAAGGKPA